MAMRSATRGSPGHDQSILHGMSLLSPRLAPILMLICSNVFMTFAWYGHLKHRSWTLLQAIIFSWLIALGEYCFQVPANRFGYGRFTAYQLKIMQEAITLVVFVGFAYFYLGEDLRWNYALSGVCLFGAVMFAFWGHA